MLALTFSLLAGCHLFVDYYVECTSDMPCARDADADTDADTDTDTDTDTAPPAEPTVGWVVSLVGDAGGRVRVYDPETAEVTAEWSGFGRVGGIPYYDPADKAGLLLGDTDVVGLGDDGSTTSYGDSGLGTVSYDVSRLGNLGLLAVQGGVVRFNETLGVVEEVVPYNTFTTSLPVGGGADAAYFTDVANGGPDLWRINADWTYEQVYEDYDSSTQRGANVFVGPAGAAFACSASGGVYEVDDLFVGSRDPYVAYGEIADVVECAFDPATEQFLLASLTTGIARLDADGTAAQVYSPPNGYTLSGVFFYEQ